MFVKMMWMGRTDIEDALQRLDSFTKVCSAKSNETLVKVNDENAEMATHIRHRTSQQHCLSVFIYVLASFSLCSKQWRKLNVCRSMVVAFDQQD